MSSWAIRDCRDRILEPSFGGCSLLQSATERLRALGNARPHESFIGFDVDSHAFGHLVRLFGFVPPGFEHRDFLDVRAPSRSIDVVLANPPFVGYRQLTQMQRTVVRGWRERFDSGLSAESGLWAYFVANSLTFLKEGGRIVFVLPSAFLTADYSKALLERIREVFREVRVVRISEAIFRPVGANERTCVLLADGYVPLGARRRATLSYGELDSVDPTSWSRVTSAQNSDKSVYTRAARVLAQCKTQTLALELGDIARPIIGEVTGDNQFFVGTIERWTKVGILRRDLIPIFTSSAQLGQLRCASLQSAEWLLAPTQPLDDSVEAYLNRYKKRARSAVRTFAKRDPWWNVGYDLGTPAFVPSLHHHNFRVVANNVRATCSNSIYKLIDVDESVAPIAIALGSQSTVAQLSAEILSRSFGGGALKLEPSDVRKLLIPSAFFKLSAPQLAKLTVEMEQFEGDDIARRLIADAVVWEDAAFDADQAAAVLMELRSARQARARK